MSAFFKYLSMGNSRLFQVLIVFVFFHVLVFVQCYKLKNGKKELSDRSSRLFPLFSIVRISNQPCVPDASDSVGTCFTNNQCRNAGGVTSGSCASGFGVCCVVTATCESVVTQNNTNIRNRDYPDAFTPGGLEVCNVRMQKPNSNVCQIRLDFIKMDLSPADQMSGQCMTDRLNINGVSGSVPPNLCGDLSGQHMYLDYGSSDRITMSIITDGAASNKARQWNVRATFIECNSILRAPDGCLQYYTTATGQVKMFGFPMANHLADLDYTVCVRSEDGSGSIVWSPCTEYNAESFILVGTAPTDGATGTVEENCLNDYVLIMSESEAADGATPKMHDRYCGSAFATAAAPHMVRSIAKPFIMRVKTDASEADTTETGNTGFCLAYRQEPPRPTG